MSNDAVEGDTVMRIRLYSREPRGTMRCPRATCRSASSRSHFGPERLAADARQPVVAAPLVDGGRGARRFLDPAGLHEPLQRAVDGAGSEPDLVCATAAARP